MPWLCMVVANPSGHDYLHNSHATGSLLIHPKICPSIASLAPSSGLSCRPDSSHRLVIFLARTLNWPPVSCAVILVVCQHTTRQVLLGQCFYCLISLMGWVLFDCHRLVSFRPRTFLPSAAGSSRDIDHHIFSPSRLQSV